MKETAYHTLADCIGNTPLVKIQRLPVAPGNTVLVKLEGNNPAGSVKDRPAYHMIHQAQLRGEIKPGDTVGGWVEEGKMSIVPPEGATASGGVSGAADVSAQGEE